jgi:hypothetical protein
MSLWVPPEQIPYHLIRMSSDLTLGVWIYLVNIKVLTQLIRYDHQPPWSSKLQKLYIKQVLRLYINNPFTIIIPYHHYNPCLSFQQYILSFIYSCLFIYYFIIIFLPIICLRPPSSLICCLMHVNKVFNRVKSHLSYL